MSDFHENNIEWLTGSDRATITVSQRKFITRIRRMCEKCPRNAQIIAENEDGSIVAHIPTSAIHLSILSKKMLDGEGFKDVPENEEEDE